ncbi:transmembrane protein, putative [Medicago truncatula]|uniref:Transmembrane protein, putative n=1 Tax=Medicago truncatula TaxID=3880 RepID=A0A072VVH7_MEDTR|nr:transmembrane protein, putative [Medicago truncatula]
MRRSGLFDHDLRKLVGDGKVTSFWFKNPNGYGSVNKNSKGSGSFNLEGFGSLNTKGADGGVYGWLCSLSSSCCSLFGTSVVWGLWALGLDTVLTANPFAEFYTLIVLCECPLFTLFCNLVSRPYAGSLGCASD